MADTSQIFADAEKLGQLVARHPAVERYTQATKTVGDDPVASRDFAEFNRQLETILRQEQSGMPMSDAQQSQLAVLQDRIASNIKYKAMQQAQVEFYDLLRKVNQTVLGRVTETTQGAPGGASGGGGGARLAGMPR